MTTSTIDSLNFETIEEESLETSNMPSCTTEKEMLDTLFDLEFPIETRLECLKKCKPDLAFEVIRRFNNMWYFACTKRIEEFLLHVCKDGSFDVILRIESAKALTTGSKKGYEAILTLLTSDLPTPIRAETIFLLFEDVDLLDKANELFFDLIDDQSIDADFRLGVVQSIDYKVDSKHSLRLKHDALLRFVSNVINYTMYRIVACQMYLTKVVTKDVTKDNEVHMGRDRIEKALFGFVSDDYLDDNLRADACDVILRYGTDDTIRSAALTVIAAIGDGGGYTLYDNKQNIHHSSIEQSATDLIEKLYETTAHSPLTFAMVRDCILEETASQLDETSEVEREKLENIKKSVNMALTRISIDSATYGKFNLTLRGILTLVWNYIVGNEYEKELKRRLIEELVDSYKMCSTGYAFRIVNTLSGFTEFGVTISFEDQIISNLNGRLNAKIRELEDEDFKGDVLSEMTLPAEYTQDRMNFLKFFRTNISKIREDLHAEFASHIDDTDFDLYFRKALMHYEGC